MRHSCCAGNSEYSKEGLNAMKLELKSITRANEVAVPTPVSNFSEKCNRYKIGFKGEI